MFACSNPFFIFNYISFLFDYSLFVILNLQAMSALLCCGPCFDSQYLTEDGLIYPWLDTLLISTDDKVKINSFFGRNEFLSNEIFSRHEKTFSCRRKLSKTKIYLWYCIFGRSNLMSFFFNNISLDKNLSPHILYADIYIVNNLVLFKWIQFKKVLFRFLPTNFWIIGLWFSKRHCCFIARVESR